MKILRFPVFIFCVCLTATTYGQIKLTENAEVAIVTIGPYQPEVYSAFGHSGFLVRDVNQNINWFYNYGLYDFEQENFFLNFAFGLLKYKVGVGDYRRVFYHHQKLENRFVKEQFLNFTLQEKQQLFDFLQENVKPENAEYLYNYVYDNCATKLPEVINKLFPGRINYDFSYKVAGKSVRNLMDDYLEYQAWGDFGIDLGLGLQIDKEADAETYLFLPDYVHLAFEKATIKRDSVEVPLVIQSKFYPAPKPEEWDNGLLTPFNFFLIMFFIVGFITNRDFKRQKRTKWIDGVLFSLAGVVGLWVAFLWFGTEHLSKWNLNILWALPTHLVAISLLSKASYRKAMKYYFKGAAIWYAVLLLIWALLPQPLHMSLVPLVLAMVLRGFYIGYDLRKPRKHNT